MSFFFYNILECFNEKNTKEMHENFNRKFCLAVKICLVVKFVI